MKMNNIIHTQRQGFTLIELLLVMLISSVIILSVNSAYKQSHMLYSKIEENRIASQQSRLFINTLRTELSGIYIPQSKEQEKIIAFELSTLPDNTISISFFTLTPSWQSAIKSSTIAKVSYNFCKDSETNKKVITRSQQYYSGGVPIAEPKEKETILQNLWAFEFQAQDPNSDSATAFKNNLQTTKNLPSAVKLILTWPETKYLTDNQFQVTIPLLSGKYSLNPESAI